LKLILCRLKKRHTALRLPAIRRLRIAATISSSVKSDCWEIKANSQSACSSNGEILPQLAWPRYFQFLPSVAAISLPNWH
jgi:hypothetical protein